MTCIRSGDFPAVINGDTLINRFPFSRLGVNGRNEETKNHGYWAGDSDT